MKKIRYALATLIVMLISSTAFAANGTLRIASDFNVETTVQRLQQVLTNKGMTIFKTIHHSESAAKVGIPLRDTVLVIFGNPKVGSKLMQCGQSIAIDLPQKALIWQDKDGNVWLSYNDMNALAQKHGLTTCSKLVSKVGQALSHIMRAAAKQKP